MNFHKNDCLKTLLLPLQIFGFFQEDFIESYTQNIRDLAGHLNIIGKMAKDDKTKRMGLHLFDNSL